MEGSTRGDHVEPGAAGCRDKGYNQALDSVDLDLALWQRTHSRVLTPEALGIRKGECETVGGNEGYPIAAATARGPPVSGWPEFGLALLNDLDPDFVCTIFTWNRPAPQAFLPGAGERELPGEDGFIGLQALDGTEILSVRNRVIQLTAAVVAPERRRAARTVNPDRKASAATEWAPDATGFPAGGVLRLEAIGDRVFGEVLGEDALEGQLATMHPHAHRAFAQTETLGNFGMGRILDIALDQDGAHLSRQESYCPIQQVRQFVPLQLGLEIDVIGQRIGPGFRLGVVLPVIACGQLASLGAMPARADISGDRSEPG